MTPHPPDDTESRLESAGGQRWLLTYSDMITLLLAFFIILFALSTIQQQRYQALVQALRAAFNGHQVMITRVQTHQRLPYPLHDTSPQEDRIYHALERVIAQDHLAGSVELAKLPYGVNLVFLNGILFAEGHATLDAAAQQPLHDIGQIIAGIPNAIVVQGYTDALPIATPTYHSNWDLSAMRAARVADAWMAQGVDPHRIMLEGFGQWSPFASNATAAGRAQNRAVSVVILNTSLRLSHITVGAPHALGPAP